MVTGKNMQIAERIEAKRITTVIFEIGITRNDYAWKKAHGRQYHQLSNIHVYNRTRDWIGVVVLKLSLTA